MNIKEKKKELRCYKYYKEELERLYMRLGYIRDKAYNKSEPGAIICLLNKGIEPTKQLAD